MTATSSAPSLGIDANGNVTAIWLQNGAVNTANLPSGGSWSRVTSLSGSSASSPVLAVDSAGDVVVAWIASGFIESSQKPAGGSWGLTKVISIVGSEHHPAVCLELDRNISNLYPNAYLLQQSAGTFNLQTPVGNVGQFTTSGTITPVTSCQ